MIRGASELLGFTVRATDGEAGVVSDVYFDDEYWTVRYVVVEVDGASALDSRLVLVSPVALKVPRWKDAVLPLNINRQELGSCPDAETEVPVSCREEERYSRFTGWPVAGSFGFSSEETDADDGDGEQAAPERQKSEDRQNEDPHLQSCRDLIGYRLQARDGELGHVRDILISDTKWMLRYLLVDTRTWWSGKKVIIAPEWVDAIACVESRVYVDLTKEDIKASPDYVSERMLQRNIHAELARSGAFRTER